MNLRGAWLAALFGMTWLAGCQSPPVREVPPPPPPPPELHYQAAAWNDLPGWREDALIEAWPALLASCRTPWMASTWSGFCASAAAVQPGDIAAQRQLIESRLRAWRLVLRSPGSPEAAGDTGLITGYYEPFLRGSRRRNDTFTTPLYAVPDDLLTIELGDAYPALKGERVRGRLQDRRVLPYPDRAQLADGRLLAGKELLWVDSAIDAFFLQIQGSGRVQLDDGSTVRLAFADVNGRPYRAIGRVLVERGEMTVEEATAPALREWLRLHPERQQELFNQNPSVVFFREEALADPGVGPRGALGVPLTPGRSIAVDPRMLPLGAPMFIATTHPLTHAPLQRLVLAQDTGGAIRGAIRADVFFGWAGEAADAAGRMRAQGAMWLLWPSDQPLPTPSVGETAAR